MSRVYRAFILGVQLCVVALPSAGYGGISAQGVDPCATTDHDLAQMLLDTNKTSDFIEDYDPDRNGVACDHNGPNQGDGMAPLNLAEEPSVPISSALPRGNAGRTGEQPGPGPGWLPYTVWQVGFEVSGASGPVVSDNTVLVKGGDALRAYDRWSGQEFWQYPIGGSESDMPLVHGGVVYVSTSYYGGGTITAVDASTGEELWEFNGEDTSAPASTPLYADGTIYYMTTESGTNDPDTFIYALDPSSGSLRWRYESNGLGGQPPAAGSGMVFFQGEEDDYIAIDSLSGEKRWESDGPIDAAPIYSAGMVVLTGRDGTVTVLNASDGSQLWARDGFDGGEAGLGHAGGPYAAVSNGVIYITTYEGELFALRLKDGEELWQASPGVQLEGSPSVAGEIVYVGVRGGYSTGDPASSPSIIAFSTHGAELWRMMLNPYAEAWDVALEVDQSIVVVDGALYLTGQADNYGVYVLTLSG